MKKIYKSYALGDMSALYITDDERGTYGLMLLPEKYADKVDFEGWWNIEPLVQFKLLGDNFSDGFIHGHSMRNTGSVDGMTLERHYREGDKIITELRKRDILFRHVLEYVPGSLYMTVYTEAESLGDREETLEMLSSYNICGFSAIEAGCRMEDFVLYRMQSKWSMEGRLQINSFIDLNLEPAWLRIGANSERFGQVGSMPVRRYFPWMVAEDKKYGYSIGIQLAHNASWQMEVYDRDEHAAFSGGPADREFGHWMKKLKKGEVFTTPKAYLTVACEDVDGISHRLTSAQMNNLKNVPESEKSLPIIFNEYCTSWGNPTEESMLKMADALKGKGIKYCVIDAGWHVKPGNDWSDIGDWILNTEKFPHGLKYVADKIKENGMIPGIWFELEVTAKDAESFKKEDMLLKLDGIPIQTCCRRFFDMRNPKVTEFLDERVIGLLKSEGFGYIKVDYNDNIGIGCDGAESPGEGLRQNMEASRAFFRRMREMIPELVIENCSSGGHRLEPSMQEVTSMASFSDAHECVSIPIIAANVTRAILPAQSQIWAVLRAKDSIKRLFYSLSNTFLGRMCLSGDIYDLSDEQWAIVDRATALYGEVAHVIRDGRNYHFGKKVFSYEHPMGSQAVCRVSADKKEVLITVHSFGNFNGAVELTIPEEVEGELCVKELFARPGISMSTIGRRVIVEGLESFDGCVVYMKTAE